MQICGKITLTLNGNCHRWVVAVLQITKVLMQVTTQEVSRSTCG
jgi:hypothetical protein